MAVAIEEEMEEAKVTEEEKLLEEEKEEKSREDEVALLTSERVAFIMGNELLPPANNSSQRSTSPGGRKNKQLTLNTGTMITTATIEEEGSQLNTPSTSSPQPQRSPRAPPNLAKLRLPAQDHSIDFGDLATDRSTTCGSTTAPVFNDRVRFFSFSSATRRNNNLNNQQHPVVNHAVVAPRVAFLRQNTVGGGDGESHPGRPHAQLLTRAISRTYTMTSNASSSIGVEEWRAIFDKLDMESDGRADGHIPLVKFQEILESDPVWSEAVPRDIQDKILGNADRNGDGVIDYEEFMDLVRGTHIGLSRRKRRAMRELLKQTVEFIVPYKYSYQNQYSCSPPPLFMLAVSLLQVVIFAYNSAVMYKEIGYIGLNGPVPYCSHLIYDPDKRQQVWRYLTYMFIHSGLFHVTFNILIQLVLGIPLEMVHGWWRVMLVYVSGVLAGSLWTSVLRPNVFLSGASGGVYALITAHLGTVIMNFREMACPWCRMLIVLVVAVTDTVVYIYDQYVAGHAKPVSYPAHISGAVTGLLVGISALKNLNWEPHERYIWAASTFTFALLMLVAIVWNLAVPGHFQGISIDIPCISTDVI